MDIRSTGFRVSIRDFSLDLVLASSDEPHSDGNLYTYTTTPADSIRQKTREVVEGSPMVNLPKLNIYPFVLVISHVEDLHVFQRPRSAT